MPRAGGGDEGTGRIDRELKLVLAALGTLADASPLVRRELVLFLFTSTKVQIWTQKLGSQLVLFLCLVKQGVGGARLARSPFTC